jgi:hypothetical protein
MKKAVLAAACVAALVMAGTAAAALSPWTYDPGNDCTVVSTFASGTLHLEKGCATTTNASAGATITDVAGQTFSSASFTLASAAQCQGGSPRFNVVTDAGTFFLGCNNVTPTTNSDGSVTYLFNAATLAAAGQQVATPTGTIQSVDIVVDVQGSADLTQIAFNGTSEVPVTAPSGPTAKSQCKKGGWKTFTSPKFKNQGDCVSFVATHGKNEPSGA